MAALLPVTAVLTPVGPAGAQPSGQPDFSLTVSPSRMIVPADEIARARQFTVTNQGRLPVDVVVGTASFTVGRTGELVFEAGAPHSAAGWVAARPDRFHLAAGAAERVDLRIVVPTTAEPGEHQVAVIFSVPAAAGTGRIGVSRSVGAPVYVTVPGPVVDSVKVTGLRAPGLSLGGPVSLTATVSNAGTVHRDFVGGDRLAARVAGGTAPFPDFTLLRGSSRQVSARWTDPPLFCVCRVTVSATNPGGPSPNATTTIVVLPLRLIGSVLAAVLVLLLLGWLLLRWVRARRSAGPALPGVVIR
jgi:hypothetical protein